MKSEKQLQIFKNMANARYKYYILDLLSDKYFKYDRNLNIFLALTSSGSVAAWAFWERFPGIWAFIIVLAQLVNLLKPFFPFSKICKEINEKQRLFQEHLLNYEKLWEAIQNNDINGKTGRKRYMKLRSKIQKVLNFSDDIILKVNEKIKREAKNKLDLYLERNYFHT